MKEIDVIKRNGGQPDMEIQHIFAKQKKAAKRGMDMAKRGDGRVLCRKLDEDTGKKII